MHIPVHSPWLPGDIDVVQTGLVIFTMAGRFPDITVFWSILKVQVLKYGPFVGPSFLLQGRCLELSPSARRRPDFGPWIRNAVCQFSDVSQNCTLETCVSLLTNVTQTNLIQLRKERQKYGLKIAYIHPFYPRAGLHCRAQPYGFCPIGLSWLSQMDRQGATVTDMPFPAETSALRGGASIL